MSYHTNKDHNIYTFIQRVAYTSTNISYYNIEIDRYQDSIIGAYNEGALNRGHLYRGANIMKTLSAAVNRLRQNSDNHTPNTIEGMAYTDMLIKQTELIIRKLNEEEL